MKKVKNLLFQLIPILLVVALILGLSEKVYRDMIRSTTESCWDELSMAHADVSKEISDRLNDNIQVLTLASDAMVLNVDFQDEETVCSYLNSVLGETVFNRIDVIFPDGTILVPSTGLWAEDNGDKTYQELLAKGAHLSQRVPDWLTGQLTIHAFSPVTNADGESIAILGATVYCSTLAELFTSSHYGANAGLFLVDQRDGNIVMDRSNPAPGNLFDKSNYRLPEDYQGVDFITDIVSGNAGEMAYLSQTDGNTLYIHYAPVPNTMFSLVMVVPEDVIFAEVNDLHAALMRVGVVEITVIILLAIWIYVIMRRSYQSENRAREAELALLQQKELELETQYAVAADRSAFLETMAVNLPGGYHRCTTDHSFRVTFMSNSFTEITGYTMEQLQEKFGGSYLGIVAQEDREYFLSLAPQLERDGCINCAYRMLRRDGSVRWVQDSTQYVERDGEQYYQCALSDIHDIIVKQEELARQASMLDTLETNMPGGYHRCADADGWPFLYISRSFEEVTGWTREEIQTEFDNQFINMVLPEDIPLCAGIVQELQEAGYSNAMYRLKKKGGGSMWVSDSTKRVDVENGRFYHGVLADVSRQVAEMERAKQEAEASSRAKSTFLFNISHDIRTPMNAIKGFSRIIEENARNPELVQESVGKIHQASDSLMMLMNDVLDISRIERGKEDLNLRPVDLNEHAQNLFEMFKGDMCSADIHFSMEGDTHSDHVYCDELKLTRIIMNMLSNAKKFTPPGGRVVFGRQRLDTDGQCASYRFYVRDTGIGMSAEFQKRAFEQFERERTSTESGVTGSGLGLAIIKMLAELMGGTVEIRSELGKGTEISAVLTFQLADQEQQAQAIAEQNTQDISGKRILLVEDNDFNREIARYILEGLNLTVEEAENGAVCIEKLLTAEPGTYDLILMDIQMPVMDGYTATIEIRNLADQRLSSIPIVAMTANAFEEDKQRCLNAGMNAHIGKPIDVAALMTELANVFH